MAFQYWERKRSEELEYARRRPERTDLYRVVHSAHERLDWEWESRFQHRYGFLRGESKRGYEQYLKCGIPAFGCARVECCTEGCGGRSIAAFSCKRRHICPSCSAKRAVHFAEHLHERVLHRVPIRHMVCSVPKRVRAFFKYDRKLHSILFQAGWKTIQDLICEVLPYGKPAAVQAIQTAGELLNHNPHLHNIIATGVFGEDGTFYELPYFNKERFTEYFAQRVLRHLTKAELITAEIAEEILSWNNTGFSVWIGDPIAPEDDDARRFLSRYIHRAPISLEKINLEGVKVVVESEELGSATFEPTEFLAELQQHLPNRYESVVRYYGEWSYRARGQRERENQSDEPEILTYLEDASKKQISRSWAALIQKIYEIDPLCCKKCGGEMRIKKFYVHSAETEGIISELGLDPFEAPPPLRAPPDCFESALGFVEPDEFGAEQH